MSDEKNEPRTSEDRKKTQWKTFCTIIDAETGVQLIMQKGGGTYSPQVGFTHGRSGEFTKFGRINPDYESDLDKFEAIDYLIEALQRIRNDVNPMMREAAKRDRDAYLIREERRNAGQGAPRGNHQKRPARASGKPSNSA